MDVQIRHGKGLLRRGDAVLCQITLDTLSISRFCVSVCFNFCHRFIVLKSCQSTNFSVKILRTSMYIFGRIITLTVYFS